MLIALPLAEQILLRLHGPDTESFLQGQLSSDLRKLTSQQAQISSYSTAKGRMLAVLHLFRSGDDVLIETQRELADVIAARLKMFVLRAKVQIERADPALQMLGLIGAEAPAWLSAAGLPCPEQPLSSSQDSSRGLIVTRRLGETPRYSVIGNADMLQALRTSLPAGAWRDSGDDWRRSDIEAGVPVVYPQTREHFVPQMANLDLLDGIAFDKGCYTGQEIVARLHYLGQLKRRMFRCRINGVPPQPGSAVLNGDEPQAVGEVVDAVALAPNQALASIVLQLGSREATRLRLENGAAIDILGGPSS